jgi:hypothetical protein
MIPRFYLMLMLIGLLLSTVHIVAFERRASILLNGDSNDIIGRCPVCESDNFSNIYVLGSQDKLPGLEYIDPPPANWLYRCHNDHHWTYEKEFTQVVIYTPKEVEKFQGLASIPFSQETADEFFGGAKN